MSNKKIPVDIDLLDTMLKAIAGNRDALRELQLQHTITGSSVQRLLEQVNLRRAILDAQKPDCALSADLVRRLFTYNPETGIFTRKISAGPWRAGSVAGADNGQGYIRILVGKKLYSAHRLAFLYMKGKWPGGLVDHINGDPADNRFCNLRDVSPLVNSQNIHCGKGNKKEGEGFLGASLSRKTGKFLSTIRSNGKTLYLGSFDKAEDAHSAYLDAKRRLHEGCTI